FKLGRYPTLSVKQARERARTFLADPQCFVPCHDYRPTLWSVVYRLRVTRLLTAYDVVDNSGRTRSLPLNYSRGRRAAPWRGWSVALMTFDRIPAERRVLPANRQRLLVVLAIIPSLESVETIPLLDGDALGRRALK